MSKTNIYKKAFPTPELPKPAPAVVEKPAEVLKAAPVAPTPVPSIPPITVRFELSDSRPAVSTPAQDLEKAEQVQKVEVTNPTPAPAFPKIQQVEIVKGIAVPAVEFPKVQKVEVTNPTTAEKVVFPDVQKVRIENPAPEIPVNEANIPGKADPTKYVPVRLTNGEKFYQAQADAYVAAAKTVFPFVDPTGKPKPVQLDAQGNLPTSATVTPVADQQVHITPGVTTAVSGTLSITTVSGTNFSHVDNFPTVQTVAVQSMPQTTVSGVGVFPVSQTYTTVSGLILQNAATGTGTGTPMSVVGYGVLAVQVVGITSATITWEATQDDNTWVAIFAYNRNGNAGLATTATADGLYQLDVAGYSQVRARISVYASGTITVTGKALPLGAPMPAVRAVIQSLSGGSTIQYITGPNDGATNGGTSMVMAGFGWIYNGTSWDRTREVANATNSTGTGIMGAGMLAQFDDVSPTTITENQFGNLRMSNNRNLYGTIRDAAGNERGVNVNANNQLSVSVDNSPTTQGITTAVSGTITTVSGSKTDIQNFPTVQTVNVQNLPPLTTVSGSKMDIQNFPTVQTVNVLNMPAQTSVSGTQHAVVDNFPTVQTVNATVVNPPSNPATISGTVDLTSWTSTIFGNLNTSIQTVKAAAGRFGGYYIYNPNSSPATLQVFDTTATPTLGVTKPDLAFEVPATAGANLELTRGRFMQNGIKIAATTTISGSVSPTIPIDATIFYI